MVRRIFLVAIILIISVFSLQGETVIRVLIYWCEGAAKTAEIEKSLAFCNENGFLPGYRFEVTRKWFDATAPLNAGVLDKFDVLIVPGGYVYKFPRSWVREDVRGWVGGGGGYVGICAGEILAIDGSVKESFFGSYQGLEIAPNVERIGSQWVGARNIRMSEQGTSLFGYAGEQRMLVWNGSILRYRGTPSIGKQVFAIYSGNGPDLEDVGHGGDLWQGEWNGGAALLGDTFWKGRVMLSSPHPEFPSEQGKYRKARMIGAMVKWAFQDNRSVPYILGRDDKLSTFRTFADLTAMSSLVTADSSIGKISVFLEEGTVKGRLGIYSGGMEDRPGKLLAQTGEVVLSGAGEWQTVDLREEVRVKKDSTVWLAWVFDGPVSLAVDTDANVGNLGGTLLRSSFLGWNDMSEEELPAFFPVRGENINMLVGIHALGSRASK